MDHCCQNSYDHTFNKKRAQKELNEYMVRGPRKSTRYLLDPLRKRVTAESSILDIGGGVGALVWELLEQGVEKISYIDISEAYSSVFREQLTARAMDKKIQVVTGDFTEQHHLLPQVDIITLDKVICCYEHFDRLVGLSIQKAQRMIAYTVPMDTWWVKAVHWIEVVFKKIFRSGLTTYIHPVNEIEKLVLAAGFKKDYQKSNMGWLTVVYSK